MEKASSQTRCLERSLRQQEGPPVTGWGKGLPGTREQNAGWLLPPVPSTAVLLHSPLLEYLLSDLEDHGQVLLFPYQGRVPSWDGQTQQGHQSQGPASVCATQQVPGAEPGDRKQLVQGRHEASCGWGQEGRNRAREAEPNIVGAGETKWKRSKDTRNWVDRSG